MTGRDVAVACVAFGVFSLAHAGPVEVYREGAQFCPHDRRDDAPVLSESQVNARAITLLPGFCAPSTFVSGCDAQSELVFGDWRVFVRQYRLRDGHREFEGLDHSYVILDKAGNCLANIPGTSLGATH